MLLVHMSAKQYVKRSSKSNFNNLVNAFFVVTCTNRQLLKIMEAFHNVCKDGKPACIQAQWSLHFR